MTDILGSQINTSEEASLNEATKRVHFLKSGLTIDEDMTFAQWHNLGKWLGELTQSVGFWIGDWLTWGEQKWGEMYSQALDDTGLAYGTLANMKWVSQKVPFEIRRDELSYSHHVAVAPLPWEQKIEMLDLAVEDGLSVKKLRDRVKNVADGEDTSVNYRPKYQYVVVFEITRPSITETKAKMVVKTVFTNDPLSLDDLEELKLEIIADPMLARKPGDISILAWTPVYIEDIHISPIKDQYAVRDVFVSDEYSRSVEVKQSAKNVKVDVLGI